MNGEQKIVSTSLLTRFDLETRAEVKAVRSADLLLDSVSAELSMNSPSWPNRSLELHYAVDLRPVRQGARLEPYWFGFQENWYADIDDPLLWLEKSLVSEFGLDALTASLLSPSLYNFFHELHTRVTVAASVLPVHAPQGREGSVKHQKEKDRLFQLALDLPKAFNAAVSLANPERP